MEGDDKYNLTSSNQNLTIKDIQPDDLGPYTCQLTLVNRKVFTRTAYLWLRFNMTSVTGAAEFNHAPVLLLFSCLGILMISGVTTKALGVLL